MRLLLIVFLCFTGSFFAQESPGLKILILAPNKVTFEKAMEKSLKRTVSSYKDQLDLEQAEKFFHSDDFKKWPENAQLTARYEVNYLKSLSHENLSSYLAEQFLSNRLIRKLKGCIFKVKNLQAEATPEALGALAREEEMDLVINFSEVTYYSSYGKYFCDMKAQLYELKTNTILIDQKFTGNASNPGQEFACEDGSINCAINTALKEVLGVMTMPILERDPGQKQANELKQKRDRVMDQLFVQHAADPNLLRTMIPATDSAIILADAYLTLFNESKSCFIAFFAEKVPADNGKAFQKRKGDRNPNIISSGSEMDFFSGKLPNTYAYVVTGVLHDGMWFYEKTQVTYFDAKSLKEGQQAYAKYLSKWHFFKDSSDELNPEFWDHPSTGATFLEQSWLFERIDNKLPDARESYREYNGVYRIVADQLRKK